MPKSAPKKRVVGLALMASAGILVLLAILFGVGVIPVAESGRPFIVGALALGAAVDVFMGLRFLASSAE